MGKGQDGAAMAEQGIIEGLRRQLTHEKSMHETYKELYQVAKSLLDDYMEKNKSPEEECVRGRVLHLVKK